MLYTEGVSLDAARGAVAAAGGKIVKENTAVGLATVRTNNSNFMAAIRQQRALAGASRNVSIGYAPLGSRSRHERVEREGEADVGAAQASDAPNSHRGPEPLADLQWDMAMIHATADGSYREQRGSKKVLVGGLTLDPSTVKRILKRTATEHACPNPRLFHYPDPDLPPAFDAFCAGDKDFNGFYGSGIVDALHAVEGGN